MKTIYIERSSGQGRDGDWVERLDLDGVGRIVVGTGPGSFAGIRSAIAFAQGYALGSSCEVLGLPSPCAVAAKVFARMGYDPKATGSVPKRLAVVGDARCGKLWIAVFDGFKLERDVFQVDKATIASVVDNLPGGPYSVVTPDEQRIGNLLEEAFGGRYMGGQTPDAEGLRLFAESNPSILKSEPLPIYLNPAVRSP